MIRFRSSLPSAPAETSIPLPEASAEASISTFGTEHRPVAAVDHGRLARGHELAPGDRDRLGRPHRADVEGDLVEVAGDRDLGAGIAGAGDVDRDERVAEFAVAADAVRRRGDDDRVSRLRDAGQSERQSDEQAAERSPDPSHCNYPFAPGSTPELYPREADLSGNL